MNGWSRAQYCSEILKAHIGLLIAQVSSLDADLGERAGILFFNDEKFTSLAFYLP